MCSDNNKKTMEELNEVSGGVSDNLNLDNNSLAKSAGPSGIKIGFDDQECMEFPNWDENPSDFTKPTGL